MKKYLFCIISLLISTLLNATNWSLTDSLIYGRKGYNLVLLSNGNVMVLGGYPDAQLKYEIFFPATGQWEIHKDIPYNGLAHPLALLMPNGKVIATNGGTWFLYNPITDTWDTSNVTLSWATSRCYTLLKDGRMLANYTGNSYTLYDTTDVASATASSPSEHRQSIEVLLKSGKVLAQGGFANGFATHIYNPATQTWSSAPNSIYERGGGQMGILLPPEWNKVLVVGGGFSGGTCELYDENANTWTATASTASDRDVGTLALIPSGKVLAIGGCTDGLTESYDPTLGTWTTVDTMIYKDRDHFSIAILPTGKVMAVGSFNDTIAEKIPEIYDNNNPVWNTQTPLNTARKAATVTLLPIEHTSNCSTNVLVAGGEGVSGILNTCELYNYKVDSVAYTGTLNTARTQHTANLLTSDEVLTAGGRNSGGALSSCELWNLTSGNWTNTGSMTTPRFDHTATQMKNGTVIVTGGENSGGYVNTCESFNGSTWSPAGTMNTARARHSAILLLNGNLLVIGGETAAGTYTATCEIWNGTNWTATGSLSTARSLHTATLLQSGKVLVIGGRNSGGALSSCEIYDPVAGTWSPETPLTTARYAHNASLLYSGLLLVSGGYTGSAYLNSCEIFDPSICDPVTELHQWKTVASPMATNRAYHGSVLIPIDKPYILAIGGNNGSFLSSIERFDIGLGYLDTWQSVIGNYPAVTQISSNMDIRGYLFRGVSEADGGNHCHVSSNDHPIISLVRIGGGNWQGNGGGEILTMPNSIRWDTARTVVTPTISDFQGYYRLWSIVNGIPCKWYKDCGAGVEEKNSELKKQGLKAYPNPFYACTKISGSNEELKVYDLGGRTIGITKDGLWNGKDLKGKEVRAGIYFVRTQTDESLKLIKIR